MRLIFMGTPDFAVPPLRKLIDDGHDVAAVFTQPDKPAGRGNRPHESPIKRLAAANGIPVYQPAKIKTNEDVRRVFEEIAPDACIVAAYGKILPPWLLEIPRFGCINIHASVLPKFRGAAPINWAIATGETATGVTIMQMDPGMDTGPLWATRSTAIGPDETAPELTIRLSRLGAGLVAETLPMIATGNVSPVPQDSSQATYAPILKKADGAIDWKLPAKVIADRVRAFQPWPGTYTSFRDSRLILWRVRARFDADASSTNRESLTETTAELPNESRAVSTIVAVDKSGFDVLCGEGTRLLIEEIQIEGKKRLAARDFFNGARLSVGDRIGPPR